MGPRIRTNKEQSSADETTNESRSNEAAVSGENTEEYPKFEPSIYKKRKRRLGDGVRWFPIVKRLFYISLIILVPMILNYAALNHELRVLPPKSAVVYDIGWGQKLLLHCTGTGLPTVILEAPIGQASYVWSQVQPILAKQTRVCSYDRAGIGFSDRAYQNTSRYANDYSEATKERDRTLPSTVERMVEDMRKLLTVASNQPKPFLLVSVDFTTLISRFYAQLYEYEVAGLLLIDPAPETIFEAGITPQQQHKTSSSEKKDEEQKTDTPPLSPWTNHWYRMTVPHLQSLHMSGSLGFNRLGLMTGLMSPLESPDLADTLNKDIIAIKKHLLCQPKHLSSAFDEYYFMNESLSQIKTIFKLKPSTDVMVNIATFKKTSDTLTPELTEIWRKEQQKVMKKVYPHSLRTTLPGSDYVSLYQHPQAVVKLIMAMANDWRGKSKAAE